MIFQLQLIFGVHWAGATVSSFVMMCASGMPPCSSLQLAAGHVLLYAAYLAFYIWCVQKKHPIGDWKDVFLKVQMLLLVSTHDTQVLDSIFYGCQMGEDASTMELCLRPDVTTLCCQIQVVVDHLCKKSCGGQITHKIVADFFSKKVTFAGAQLSATLVQQYRNVHNNWIADTEVTESLHALKLLWGSEVLENNVYKFVQLYNLLNDTSDQLYLLDSFSTMFRRREVTDVASVALTRLTGRKDRHELGLVHTFQSRTRFNMRFLKITTDREVEEHMPMPSSFTRCFPSTKQVAHAGAKQKSCMFMR